MLVPYFGELFLAESPAELDQCWPQTAMHVRNLALTSLQTRTLGLSQIAFVAEDLQNRTTELYKETLDNVVDLRCAAEA